MLLKRIVQTVPSSPNVAFQRNRNAPIVEDPSVFRILPTRYKDAGSELLFEVSCKPADESTVVRVSWKVKSEN